MKNMLNVFKYIAGVVSGVGISLALLDSAYYFVVFLIGFVSYRYVCYIEEKKSPTN